MELINEILLAVKNEIEKYNVIYLTQYGSHLYGLNTKDSDYDFRGIYTAELNDIILKKDKDEINTEITIPVDKNGLPTREMIAVKEIKVDIKLFSVQKFFKLCSKGDTNALDVLFAMKSNHQYQFIYSPIGFEFVDVVHKNMNKLIDTSRLQSPITYAYKQAEKYSLKNLNIKLYDILIELSDKLIINTVSDLAYELEPYIKTVFDEGLYVKEMDGSGKFLHVLGSDYAFNLRIGLFKDIMQQKRDKYSLRSSESKGNDWKSLSHAIRILTEIKELLTTESISFPVKNADFIKSVKLGKVSRQYIDVYFERELSDVLDLVRQNKLQWSYQEEFWNAFILKWTKENATELY